VRISGLDTIRLETHPNLLYVQLHSDDGLMGLGETFFGARAVEAYLHETLAPSLLGKQITSVDDLSLGFQGYLGFSSSGAETRGNSAVDTALWDMLARSRGVPLHRLLNERSRTDLPVYNTCAGPEYVQQREEVATTNWGLPADAAGTAYEDLEAFLHRSDELANSLLEQGITGMKIWPFDPFAEASDGQYISMADLRQALAPIEKVRRAVGDRIEVMIELHGLWNVPMAQRIAAALEEYRPRWIEDPIRLHNFDAMGRVAESTQTPIAAGETLGGPSTHERLIERGLVGIVIVDIAWAGGVTAAWTIAKMAEQRGREVAFHDCTGPVGLAVATHLGMASPTARVQEIVRAFYATWYESLVTTLPPIKDGRICPPPGPGLGLELNPDLLKREDCIIRSVRTEGRP
jgi:L-alanine-DL-glutamate epimerase-like enolase superfamily enzyme